MSSEKFRVKRMDDQDILPVIVRQLVAESTRDTKRRRCKQPPSAPLTAMLNLMMTSRQHRDAVRQQIGALFTAAARFNVQGCPTLAVPPIRQDVLSLDPGLWNKNFKPFPDAIAHSIILRHPDPLYAQVTLKQHHKARIAKEPQLEVLAPSSTPSPQDQRKIVAYFVSWVLNLLAEKCANCNRPFTQTLPKSKASFAMNMAVCQHCHAVEWRSAKQLFRETGVTVSCLRNKVLMKNIWDDTLLWSPHIAAISGAFICAKYMKRVATFLSAYVRARAVRNKIQNTSGLPALRNASPWIIQNPPTSLYVQRKKKPKTNQRRTYTGPTLTCMTAKGEILLIAYHIAANQMSQRVQAYIAHNLPKGILDEFAQGNTPIFCLLNNYDRPIPIKTLLLAAE